MAFNDISILKVLTWVCMVTLTRSQDIGQNSSNVMRTADVVNKFIGNILSPLINDAETPEVLSTIAKHQKVGVRSGYSSRKHKTIIALIESKVDSLTPYLQDNDKSSDETTIIEFYPRRNNVKGVEYATFENLHRYRKIRDVIKINLDKESVSNETKSIVIKTIDALINQLNKSRCTQRTADDSVITLRNGESIDSKNLTISMKDWKNITNLFFNNLKTTMTSKPEKLLTKADEINDFFINIINNTINTNTKQRMRCELVEVPRTTEDESNYCPNFKICSTELKKYLKQFYEDSSETLHSTFTNYAAMFIRDANVDYESEKVQIEKYILKMAETNKDRKDKVFEKHIPRLKLDKNKDKTTNVNLIDDFLKGVKKHILKYIKKHIATDLIKLRARTLFAVKDDLLSYLFEDLQTLVTKYMDKKCKDFSICNDTPLAIGRRSGNDNGVYVNLKFDMDDELRDTILKPKSLFKKYIARRNGRRYLNKVEKNTYKVTRTTLTDIRIENVTVSDVNSTQFY